MSTLDWCILGFFVVAGGIALWYVTPVWQCPVCHSYNVAESKVDGVDYLMCLNDSCRHEWRAV
jgi:hypothetical protein